MARRARLSAGGVLAKQNGGLPMGGPPFLSVRQARRPSQRALTLTSESASARASSGRAGERNVGKESESFNLLVEGFVPLVRAGGLVDARIGHDDADACGAKGIARVRLVPEDEQGAVGLERLGLQVVRGACEATGEACGPEAFAEGRPAGGLGRDDENLHEEASFSDDRRRRSGSARSAAVRPRCGRPRLF